MSWRVFVTLSLSMIALEASVLLVALPVVGDTAGVQLPFLPESDAPATRADAASPAPRLPPRPDIQGTAVGDSVLLAAEDALVKGFPGISVDAVVGRVVDDGIIVLRRRAAAGTLGDVVLVHLGNNGELSDAQFEEIAAIVGPQRRFLVVTVRVPLPWQGPNNDVIARGVARHSNALLVDWYAASANQPSLLWDDGVHLRPEGVTLYANLVSRYLAP